MLDLMPVRIRRYNEQRGRCIYCYGPMWEEAIEPQGLALGRLRRSRAEQDYDCLENLASFACTAEHLLPQAKGALMIRRISRRLANSATTAASRRA
jgi:hypothetical protein